MKRGNNKKREWKTQEKLKLIMKNFLPCTSTHFTLPHSYNTHTHTHFNDMFNYLHKMCGISRHVKRIHKALLSSKFYLIIKQTMFNKILI